MRNNRIPIIIYTALIALSIGACTDEYDNFQAERVLNGDIQEFMTTISEDYESFVVNPAEEKFSAMTIDGHTVNLLTKDLDYQGAETINLNYKVTSTVGELIKNNITTISGTDIINVDCIIDVKAQHQGNEIAIKNDRTIGVIKPQEGELFGRHLYSIPKSSEHVWSDISSDNEDALQIQEWESEVTGETVAGFESRLSSFGRHVIGMPLPELSTGQSSICAKLPDSFSGTNTKVYFTLDGTTSLVPLVWNSEKVLFCDLLGNLPTLLVGKLISVTEKEDGQIYFGMIDVQIEDGFEYELSPSNVSKPELVEMLNTL